MPLMYKIIIALFIFCLPCVAQNNTLRNFYLLNNTNAASTISGGLRWTGTQVQYSDGTNWTAFSAGGGGTPITAGSGIYITNLGGTNEISFTNTAGYVTSSVTNGLASTNSLSNYYLASNPSNYVTASITNGLGGGASGTPLSGIYDAGISTNGGVITFDLGTTNSQTGTNGATHFIATIRITNTTALNFTNARPGQIVSVVIESHGTSTNFTVLNLTNSNYRMIGGLTNVINVTTNQTWLFQGVVTPRTNINWSYGVDYR